VQGIASAQGAWEYVSMTLTERKRHDHPERYIRKDARKRIYRELYGQSGEERGLRTNVPATDETRRLSSFWSYQNAEHVYKANFVDAMFTAVETATIERRFEQLRHYKPRSATQIETSHIIDAMVSTLK
jgi:hypothetical protein